MRGPHRDMEKTGIVCGACGCISITIGIGVRCGAYGCIGIEVVIVVGCGAYGCIGIEVVIGVGWLWICIIGEVGGRMLCVRFVVGDLRFVPIMFVGQPNTSDETHAFLGY